MVNCGSICRRNLQEQQEEQEVPFIILDDYFEQDNDLPGGNDDGDRKLQTTAINTCGFTMAQCNQEKALLNQTITNKRGNVASACAASIAASFEMQCLVMPLQA
jgi:hypothetical protein